MPVYKDVKAKKNKYYYSFEIKDAHGKRETVKKRGFKTIKEATDAEIAVKDAMNKGTYIKPSKILYKDYLENWLKNRRDIKMVTKVGYDSIIQLHISPEIGNVPISEINAMTIENFLTHIESKGLSESMNRNIFKVIHKSLGDAERKQILLRNPASFVSKPKVSRKEMKSWSPEEAKTFLKSIENHRLRIIFVLAIYCGMRMAEIRGLKFADVDFDKGKIHIRNILDFKNKVQSETKTYSGTRSIALAPIVVEELRNRMSIIEAEKLHAGDNYNDNGFIVCSKNGAPYNKSMCHSLWVRLLEKKKMRKIRFHDLRHTCASLLMSLDIHPKIVQEILGHSSSKITLDLYSHLSANMQSKAADALAQLLQ